MMSQKGENGGGKEYLHKMLAARNDMAERVSRRNYIVAKIR